MPSSDARRRRHVRSRARPGCVAAAALPLDRRLRRGRDRRRRGHRAAFAVTSDDASGDPEAPPRARRPRRRPRRDAGNVRTSPRPATTSRVPAAVDHAAPAAALGRRRLARRVARPRARRADRPPPASSQPTSTTRSSSGLVEPRLPRLAASTPTEQMAATRPRGRRLHHRHQRRADRQHARRRRRRRARLGSRLPQKVDAMMDLLVGDDAQRTRVLGRRADRCATTSTDRGVRRARPGDAARRPRSAHPNVVYVDAHDALRRRRRRLHGTRRLDENGDDGHACASATASTSPPTARDYLARAVFALLDARWRHHRRRPIPTTGSTSSVRSGGPNGDGAAAAARARPAARAPQRSRPPATATTTHRPCRPNRPPRRATTPPTTADRATRRATSPPTTCNRRPRRPPRPDHDAGRAHRHN